MKIVFVQDNVLCMDGVTKKPAVDLFGCKLFSAQQNFWSRWLKKKLLIIITPSANPFGLLLETQPFQGDFPVTATIWELLLSHMNNSWTPFSSTVFNTAIIEWVCYVVPARLSSKFVYWTYIVTCISQVVSVGNNTRFIWQNIFFSQNCIFLPSNSLSPRYIVFVRPGVRLTRIYLPVLLEVTFWF